MTTAIKKQIGIVGLGKMGAGIARQLMEKSWQVAGYNRSPQPVEQLAREGLLPAGSLAELIGKLERPRLVWLMVPAGRPVEETLFGAEGLNDLLEAGDIVVDGGNSFYKDDPPRAEKLAKKGIGYVDAGVSGGPHGARHGACLMVGGRQADFDRLRPLYLDLAVADGVQFFEGHGAGHFVKMVHNGIEYGMMQAIAEGFNLMKHFSDYRIDLKRAASVYNHASVIESRLIGWLERAFEVHGEDLADLPGAVGHTGEGEWTVKIAREAGLEVRVIQDAFQFRVDSAKNPSYTGRVLSALREQFGGHKR